MSLELTAETAVVRSVATVSDGFGFVWVVVFTDAVAQFQRYVAFRVDIQCWATGRFSRS